MHGTLDHFRAFQYENYLYKIKQMVKISRKPLEQVVNRLSERQQITIKNQSKSYPQLKCEVENSTDILKKITCFKKLILKEFEIIINKKGNCVLVKDGRFFVISSIFQDHLGTIYIYGNFFASVSSFYNDPCDSYKLFNIALLDNMTVTSSKILYTEISQKCWLCNYNDKYFAVPLLHNELHEN